MIANFEEMLATIVRVAVREEVRPMREMLEVARPPPSGALLSVAQASQRAGVSTKTMRSWLKDGRLDPRHAGRELRVDPEELERLLRAPRQTDDTLTAETAAAKALQKLRGA